MSNELILMLKEAANMFAFLAVELTVLFLVVSYLVGVLQEYISPEKVRSILTSKNGKGYLIASLLGAITPFCSCSTIPFLKGLLRARASFGPMMVFLFSSPLLNPIVIGLLVVTFGLDVAVFYFSIAMVVAISAGFVLEKLGFERYVRDDAYREAASAGCGNKSVSATASAETKVELPNMAMSVGQGGAVLATETVLPISGCATNTSGESSCGTATASKPVEPNRWLRIWHSTWKDFKGTLPYLLLGITVGAFIYGFVPTELITEFAGENKWYAIPVAAVIGIPLYIRASAVIPLSAGLVQKGMAMGSVMALIIGSAGGSLTEVILLKSIFKIQMIAAFLVVVLGMAITAGYLYSIFF
ncbi:permease [SAR92 clade bacterium H921]|nr:permease [SAR92 clade bacterium H921]